ncbi:MAG TPA: T9SS type A sorting domain-containing protein [Panacibacter sp.]|nr:T9SS type A sorting domain-containing protein [Panacibacter sp.]HNP45339.1 T9SS type A sorting domain-containing protein [Panacibacter sp.]
MKKTLLVMVLLVSAHQLFAFSTQGKWRWRKDDGSETSATWTAAENTAITINNTNDPLRLRITLYNSGASGTGGFLDGAQFEDSSNLPGAKWTKITVDPGTNAFAYQNTSTNVTDLEATTKQLSTPVTGFTFVDGWVFLSTEVAPSLTLGKKQFTEFEYCIKATANIQPNTTYYFRVDAAEYPNGLVFPTLTTAAVLPIKLANFSVQPDNNHVKLVWTTATELNNDHFDVERSADAASWKTVVTVKGNGTSSNAHNYQALDINPVKGMNYYRIKQYDVNGKAYVSEIRSLKMFAGNSSINVFPNPAKKNINFSIVNSLADAAVTLTNSNGKVIHHETIQNIQANINYSLKLNTQPMPGVYILHLESKGFSESIKVVVE